MVIIFVLLVFVLAQGFLSVSLSSRDQALDRLNRQVTELAELLSLERGQTQELRGSLGRALADGRIATEAREATGRDLAAVREALEQRNTERDALRDERDRLSARLADTELATRGGAERVASLEQRLAEALARAESAGGETASALRDRTAIARALTAEQASRVAAEHALAQSRIDVDTTVTEMARLSEQVRALTALRDRLEREAAQSLARAEEEQRRRSTAEAMAAQIARQAAAAETKAGEYGRLSESAQARAALLSQQLDSLRAELRRVASALEAQEANVQDKDAQIASLGTRLNAALAARVEELQRYRSDFFGRLREVLGDRPDVRIVGDRFVFQSEVLFPPGSAELSEQGISEIRALARVLRDIAGRIPPEVNWLLRVDGHADRTPIRPGGRFASNWELSAARAIAVSQVLINEGLPANRVAAAAFGDNQPLDDRDTPEALARNRRIELRLTDR